jgi:dienelactone hydrolase
MPPSFLRCLALVALLAACQPAPSPLPPPTPSAAPPIITPSPTHSHTPTPTHAPLPSPTPPPGGLFAYDASAPLDLLEAGTETHPGFTQIDLSYASPHGGRVPAYLIVPDGPGPFAGLILMHGSSGNRDTQVDFARDLAPTGAVVLLISGPSGRPDRLARIDTWITFTPNDRAEQIQLIVDLQRGVDLLLSRPEVDPARLGYVGYSYGAAMGGLLAGVEHRLAAYGFMVGDGGLVAHFTDADGPIDYLAEMPPAAQADWLAAMEPIEPIEFVDEAAPAALFFQNALRDTLVSREDTEAYQAAGSEPKRVAWYDSGHGLPRQAYLDMVAWLAEHLGLDAAQFNGPPG